MTIFLYQRKYNEKNQLSPTDSVGCLIVLVDLNIIWTTPNWSHQSVRSVLFLLVFFLVTTLCRGVDCCRWRVWGGGAGTPLAGLAPPPQLIPLIYSGYMSQRRQRGHSCMYKTRPPPPVTSPRSSRIISPCQSPLRPCFLVFISYLWRCLVPALKSFPCVFVYVDLSVFNCDSM